MIGTAISSVGVCLTEPDGSGSPAAADDDPAVAPHSERREAALSGRSAARFRALVEAHFDFIWRSLRGLGVPSAAVDDAAQHVFLIASQKLESIQVGSERGFLFRTALGVAANARRARSRVREFSDVDVLGACADEAPNPEELAALRQTRRLLDNVLEAMPEDLRTVFVLFELEGLTTTEIAGLLTLPTGTVASRLRRAREEFHTISSRLQKKPIGRGSAR